MTTAPQSKYYPERVHEAQEYVDCDLSPTLAGLSGHLGVDNRAVKAWGKKYPEFQAVLDQMDIGIGCNTTYRPEYAAMALHYAAGGYKELEQCVPSVAGLAVHLGKSRPTIQTWGEKHPEFGEALQVLHDHQHVDALNGGLSGRFNAAITKLLLYNHGYSERASVDNTHKVIDDGTNEW